MSWRSGAPRVFQRHSVSGFMYTVSNLYAAKLALALAKY